MRTILVTLIFFAIGLLKSAFGETDATGSITSETNLSNVIARLNKPNTACEARRILIKFSGPNLYEGSVFICSNDSKMDNLRREAAKALHSYRSVETVQQALDDDDRDVRFWGVMEFETAYGRTAAWGPLLPRLMKLAVDDSDAGIRGEAIRRLRSYDQSRDFLHALQDSTNESVPFVLMTLLAFDSQRPEARARFYARAIAFLSNKDDAIRSHWLCYIYMNAWNPSTAPMWQIEADPGLIKKLRQIKETGSEQEKEIARKALDSLLKTSKETAQLTNAPYSSPAPRVQKR